MQATCEIPLESLNEGYNFASDLIAIRGLHKKLCALKVTGVLVVAILGLPLGSLGTKSHLDVAPVVSQVSPELPVACPSTKGVPKCELTNLLVGLMQVRVSE